MYVKQTKKTTKYHIYKFIDTHNTILSGVNTHAPIVSSKTLKEEPRSVFI